MNHYVAELERRLRSPDVQGVEHVAVLQALAIHHEVKEALGFLAARVPQRSERARCICGELDSPNHRVHCWQVAGV